MRKRTSAWVVVTPMTNEELMGRVLGGDADSIEKLLLNNQEYLYKLARRLSNSPDVIEDLVQEGTIAILDAVGRYDPVQRAMFLTCATSFIHKAMRGFMAQMSLQMTVPAARYSQLRRVNYLVAKFQMDNEERSLQGLLHLICQEMKVSEKVALGLLRDYYAVYQDVALDELWEQNIPCFDTDPAKVYEQKLLEDCLREAMEQLSPRERNLIQYHLGLNNPDEFCMTFQQLAVQLNYNGHSAAEKAYRKAIESLRQALYAGRYRRYVWAKRIVDSIFGITSVPISRKK